ncbi:Uma2 family endonuclease [Peptococcaceae bacterium 1198_IL3148]
MPVAPNKEERYTYKDYKNWPADNHWELIEGVPYAMSPAPSTEHQLISGNLFFILKNYLKTGNKKCMPFFSPYDVLLPEKGENQDSTSTVVQPDLLVVCDKSKITDKYCVGAPDLIVEIVSPSCPSMDYVKKLHLYEKNGVREYWIVNPEKKQVMVFRLMDNGDYDSPEIYGEADVAKVGIFVDLEVNINDIFIL